MIPVVAQGGSSFKGAALYYLHDKDALTRERVAWTHTENLPTNDPDKAVKVMAWTAMHQNELKQQAGVKATGRKLEKPVFSFSISWHPEETPEKEHMLDTAKSAVKQLGLSDYQTLYVSHNDEPQKHVHVIVNRVDPETGKAAVLSHSKKQLSQWARSYEKEQGKIYCQQREEKAQAREQGRGKGKYIDPVIAQAWERSDNGRSFKAALEEQGYYLAQGNKRQVIVDRYGKTHNPVRLLEGVKAKEFKAKIGDLDLKSLPNADNLQKQIKVKNRQEYHESRKYDYWASKTLNETQDRQLEERNKLHSKYHQKLEQKKKELDEYYNRNDVEKEISRLEEALEKSAFLKKISGKQKQDKTRLENLKKNLDTIKQRTNEQTGAIKSEREQSFKEQKLRHNAEKEQDKKLIEGQKPKHYQEEKVEYLVKNDAEDSKKQQALEKLKKIQDLKQQQMERHQEGHQDITLDKD